MTKIAVLGDTHFGARGDSPHFHKHFKRFYEEFFFPYLKENNIEYIFQLGDVFDRRKFVNYQTLRNARDYFFNPLDTNYKSWLLVGNHDTYYKNTNEVNSLDLLIREYNNIHQVQHPYETSFDGVSILMVPWICSENYTEVMKAIEMSRSQICIGHFEINGFEMHKGAMCDSGMDSSIFNKFDLVLSGHFHTRSKQGSINYVGTPYEMTWADCNDPKGFHILDTSTRELKFVESPYRMYSRIFYDDVDKTMADIIVDDYSQYKDTIVKVVIKNKTNPYWFDMFIEKLEKVGVFDLQVVEDHLNLNLEDDDDIISEAEDTLTILNKYVDQLDLNVDKPKLEGLLRSLYNEALSMEIT